MRPSPPGARRTAIRGRPAESARGTASALGPPAAMRLVDLRPGLHLRQVHEPELAAELLVTLMPYGVTLFSKVLFGITMGWVVQETARPQNG